MSTTDKANPFDVDKVTELAEKLAAATIVISALREKREQARLAYNDAQVAVNQAQTAFDNMRIAFTKTAAWAIDQDTLKNFPTIVRGGV